MKTNAQPQLVYDFLKRNPNTDYCDDCVEKNTGVNCHTVNIIASTLALFPTEFTRHLSVCPHGCSTRDKFLTRAK